MFQLDKTYYGWSWERVLRHVLYWLGWLLFYVITNSLYFDKNLMRWISIELVSMCIKLPFVYFVIYYLVPNFLIPKRYFEFFSLLLFSAIFAGFAIWTSYYYVFHSFFSHIGGSKFWSMKMSFRVLDLIYIASLPTILKLHQRQSLQEKKAQQLVEQKLGAELKVLKNQLHPHFLFNTLNNLYSMVLTQHPKASEVVVRLSDIMSYMLYDCERSLIDLEKEIENLKNYIELEKIRYGTRVDISFETGGEITGKSIAPLLLLPFLENAFKHGVEKNELNSWVRINLWVTEEELTYMVENSLPEAVQDENMPKTQSGVGLANVRKRLELLYPDQHSLEITHEETFLAKLNLKLSHEVPHR